jgi:type IV secretion system protein TrbG
MLSLRIVLIVTLPSAGILSAQSQTPTPPPVGVKRVPPAALGQTPPKHVPPLLQQYDFGGQLRALEGSGLPSDVKPELLVPGAPNGGAPKDFRPKSDVPLTPTALEAVRVSERWQGEKNAPLPGPDGRVMYSFGAGLPTVVCAPLRVCMIEMQAGEKIVGEPHIGDSVRWNISPAMYGTGDQATSVIILKPQTPGLDTNLLITTDRRAYYLRLISKPEDYLARVAFAYPEDDTRKWQQQLGPDRQHD